MFPEEIHKEQLLLLEKVLRREGFRFVIIGQNHRAVFDQISEWIKEKFPDQLPVSIEIAGKDYRGFMDNLKNDADKWIMIPDFDRLFEKGYEAFCTAINQRRDYFARNNKVLLCFLFEDKLKLIPDKIPDLWSLRTLELSFELDISAVSKPEMWMNSSPEINTLGGTTFNEKKSEIEHLLAQLKNVKPNEKQLLVNIHYQLGIICFSISDFQRALFHFEKSLLLTQEIGDKAGEGAMLNNISQIYDAWGNYQTALEYLEQSLIIRRKIGDKAGEGGTLNNIGQIYDARGEYQTGLKYLEQSLKIQREIGDKAGEGTTLNNLATAVYARGEYQTALKYLEQSLKIQRVIGDKAGEGATLNNISQIFKARGDYQTAIEYLEKSLKIMHEIGDKKGEGATLNNISGIYRASGDFQTALEYLEKSLKIQQEIGDKAGMIPTLHNMAHIALKQDDGDKYRKYHAEAWQLANETKDAMGLFQVGQALGENLCRFGDTKNGLEILKIAYAIGQQSGLPGTEKIGKVIAHFEAE